MIEVTAEGYTRSLRAVVVPPSGAVRMRDARLTALSDAVALDTSAGGQTVVAEYLSPAASGEVELSVAQSALAQPVDVRLTPLSPQGFVAPPPLGWSVLFGADVQIEPLASAATVLTVPAELILPGVLLAVIAAQWNEATMSWRAAPGELPPFR